jgi:hypothetical protein
MRVRPLEDDAVGGQGVDGRRLHLLVAVGGEVVGPQRVDREDDDRTADRRRRAGVPPASHRRQSRPQRGEKENEGEPKGTGHGYQRDQGSGISLIPDPYSLITS